MRFGVEIPTCTAGMMHPARFATAAQVVEVAVEAERLGYHEASGNDHLSTMRFVRDAWAEPPDYLEPLVTLANIAARTSTIRLGTGILVLPMRSPVLLAKQVATLDRLSGGRVTLGVAVGGYRDEFEAVRPDLKDASRAVLTREVLEALQRLLAEPRTTYAGRYVRFDDVETYPKPVQSPLPVLSGGNAEGSIRRAGELCAGWLPAHVSPDHIRAGRAKMAEYARAAGRDPAGLITAMQAVVCLGDTYEKARRLFLNSSFDLFRRSLMSTMTRGVSVEDYIAVNLIGSPEDVRAKVAAYAEAGVDQLSSLLFVGNTVEEMMDQIRIFADRVMPTFPEPRAR